MCVHILFKGSRFELCEPSGESLEVTQHKERANSEGVTTFWRLDCETVWLDVTESRGYDRSPQAWALDEHHRTEGCVQPGNAGE